MSRFPVSHQVGATGVHQRRSQVQTAQVPNPRPLSKTLGAHQGQLPPTRGLRTSVVDQWTGVSGSPQGEAPGVHQAKTGWDLATWREVWGVSQLCEENTGLVLEPHNSASPCASLTPSESAQTPSPPFQERLHQRPRLPREDGCITP